MKDGLCENSRICKTGSALLQCSKGCFAIDLPIQEAVVASTMLWHGFQLPLIEDMPKLLKYYDVCSLVRGICSGLTSLVRSTLKKIKLTAPTNVLGGAVISVGAGPT